MPSFSPSMSDTRRHEIQKGSATGELQFVSFYIDNQMYGIDINLVKEVNTNTGIYSIPRSQEQYRGLVNIRGQIVLVMDISVLFGTGRRPITTDSQLIILKSSSEIARVKSYEADFEISKLGDKPLAFLVDRIGDVITVLKSNIEPTPPHLSKNKTGMIRLDKELLIILTIGEFL